MAFGDPWGSPFYTGGGTSSLVPSQFHVAIAGRPYMLDTRQGGGATNADIPVQRGQTDTDEQPGEGTLSTEGLWRRTVESWHLGAGQEYLDRHEGNRDRYHVSSGIDPWTKYRASLLPATALSYPSANTNLMLAVAGGRAYVADGQTVQYTTDLANWFPLPGGPAETVRSLATDGSTLYVAYGPGGVYSVDAGGGGLAPYATGTATAVGYAKGRLLVVESTLPSPRVYNVTATGAITSGNLLLTVPGGAFPAAQFVAEGPNALYLVGNVGDQPRIWRTAVKQDGTALDVAVIAGEIPEGQTPRAAQGFLGTLLLVGTDDHLWVMGFADDAGNLVVRGNLTADSPVRAFEPQDRFVWFSGGSGLLDRLDTATNVASDPSAYTPGHAPDLDSGETGDVLSVVTFGGKRVFTVTGHGVYVEQDEKVAVGTIDLGRIGFGIGDLKNAMYADIRHEPLADGDSVQVEVSKDGGPWTLTGASSQVGSVSATVSLGQVLAETIGVRLTLTGTPVLTMVTVRAAPAPKVGELWRFALLLHRSVLDVNEQPHYVDIRAEREYLRGLRQARTAVTVQHGIETFVAIVDRLGDWQQGSRANDENGHWTGVWNGVQEVVLKVLEE